MSVFVKICGLRDINSVATAVSAGADAVGFVFAESVRQVSPAEATAAAKSIPAGVQRVAVMRHPSNDEWQSVLAGFAPDVLQTDAEDFDKLDVPESVVRWPVIREGGAAASSPLPQIYVYEGANSGMGETVDWSRAAEVATNGQMILAGGLAVSNVATAIRIVRPYGVDVSSAVESAPGHKEDELIRQFIGAVRAAENN
ncbi:MAG: phosphoribosylanthranilate isomerase [Deltaproteobacteria bacterium]|nr:phosphoribosylanthranilate isomerase [Deltaproteobacteria bacterium]